MKNLLSILFPLGIACSSFAQEKSGTMTIDKEPSEVEVVTEEVPQVFTIVEQMPVFPGGNDSLMYFLCSNIIYPDTAKELNIEGTVYVNFIINSLGDVTSARVLRGIGGGCDEEALRVVNLMPRWTPGYQRRAPVAVQYNLPIKFKLGD